MTVEELPSESRDFMVKYSSRNHIKSGQVLLAPTHPFSTCDRSARTMSDHTLQQPEQSNIPYGYCHCGCGQRTRVAERTSKRDGDVKGHPRRFVHGHNRTADRSIARETALYSGARAIPLTRGQFAIVDAADYESLSQFRWYAIPAHGGNYYAVRADYSGDTQQRVYMHRVVLGISGEVGVDHANGNGLDNRRENLRSATRSQNSCNVRRQSNNTSGFKGVSWRKDNAKWRVRVVINGSRVTIGYFDDLIKAAVAYDVAALQHYGEFARLNFPEVWR